MKSQVSAIAAMAKNRTIGQGNQLPWDYPEDMKFFREKTKGSVLIMGRKTFDSLGKPLPGRFHIVITRSPLKSEHSSVVYVQDLAAAMDIAREKVVSFGPEIFIAGGAEIYKMAMNTCDRIYLTVIDKEFPGDAFFPEVPAGQWSLTENRKSATSPDLSFQIWDKK